MREHHRDAGAAHDDWQLIFLAIFLVGGTLPLPLVVPPFLLMGPFRVAHDPSVPTNRWQALFAPDTMTNTLLLWSAFFFRLLVVYLLLNWLPQLIVSLGFDRGQASMVPLSFNFGSVIGCLLAGPLARQPPGGAGDGGRLRAAGRVDHAARRAARGQLLYTLIPVAALCGLCAGPRPVQSRTAACRQSEMVAHLPPCTCATRTEVMARLFSSVMSKGGALVYYPVDRVIETQRRINMPGKGCGGPIR